MPSILVADDNPVDRKLISRLLEREPSWSVHSVSDGSEALQYLEQQDVDLVVTDLQMPHVDGLELVKQIRKRFDSVPVVLVTAYGSEKISLQALSAGAANYSPKDQLQSDLVPTAKNVLELNEHIKRTANKELEGDTSRLAFVLDNEIGQIAQLVESFNSHLPSWATKDRLRISMALDEALTNAICHGNLELDSQLKDTDCESRFFDELQSRKDCEPFCGRRVRLQADFSDQEIRFCIRDDGPGFTPESIPDPTCAENLLKPSGRGLLLIRTFMDEVAHNESGNEITLVKRRQHTLNDESDYK